MRTRVWLTPSEWVKFTLILLFFLCGILPALWFIAFGRLPIFWLEEDGLYESAATLGCLLACILCFVAFYYSNDKGTKKRNLWLFLFALALLGLTGEELSWGQRIFGFEIPAQILQSNFQNEFNLHNAKFLQSRNNVFDGIFKQLLVAYLVVLPIGLAIFPSICKLFTKIRIPVPSLLVTFNVLTIKVTNIICHKVIEADKYGLQSPGEAFESLLEICLVIVAVEYCLSKSKCDDFLNFLKGRLSKKPKVVK